MKICKYCGHENEDDAIYCIRDGSYLGDSVNDNQENKQTKLVCKKCGFENSSEVKFCGGCGKVLKGKRNISFVSSIQIILLISIYIAIGIYIFKYGPNQKNKPEEYYIELVSNHSYDISSVGETIMFSINTNAEWLTKDDFSIFGGDGAVVDFTFVDDRNFMAKFGRNQLDKVIYLTVNIRLSKAGEINFCNYIGVKDYDEIDTDMTDKEHFRQLYKGYKVNK